MSGDPESDELKELARSLGFDPEDEFRAICIRSNGSLSEDVERIQSELSADIVSKPIARGHDLVLICQARNDRVDEGRLVTTALPEARIGVGLRRAALGGARLSIGDAERALAATTSSKPAASFEADWVPAMFIAAKDRLHPILDVGVQAAADHPEFAEAVQVLATSGFSVSEVARRLFIHPNTAMYRIKRWEELTEWDPRTFEGMLSSIAAITAARTLTEPDPV